MTNIQAGTRDDLKRVFLYIYDSAITTTVPDIAAELKINRRYANELVLTLTGIIAADGGALVVINAQPGEASNDTPHTFYQTGYIVDDRDREWMEQWFDDTVPTDVKVEARVPAPRTPLSATNPADLPLCLCGCKEPVTNRNRNYKPGHDARHAGQVARYIADQDETGDSNTREAALAMLPTEALRLKADAMATRLLKKVAAKVLAGEAKTEAKRTHVSGPAVQPVTFEVGEVKVGRWVYPAERNSTSGAVTFTRKGKDEVASDKVAASFVAKEA